MPLNVANLLDVTHPGPFPHAFIDGTGGGDYALQQMSDLVLFPLLLKYGGMYADVGMMQIGDLDRLWRETVGDPVSRFKIFSYNVGGVEGCNLINYSLPVVGKNLLFAGAVG